MEWITNYWPIILAFVAVLVVVIYIIYKFIKQPKEAQLNKIKEWLLYAVTAA